MLTVNPGSGNLMLSLFNFVFSRLRASLAAQLVKNLLAMQ